MHLSKHDTKLACALACASVVLATAWFFSCVKSSEPAVVAQLQGLPAATLPPAPPPSSPTGGDLSQVFDDLPLGFQVWLAAKQEYYHAPTTDELIDSLNHNDPLKFTNDEVDLDLIRRWVDFTSFMRVIPPYETESPITRLRSWWTSVDATERSYMAQLYSVSTLTRRATARMATDMADLTRKHSTRAGQLAKTTSTLAAELENHRSQVKWARMRAMTRMAMDRMAIV
jgi:hypothetical protein